MLSYLDNLTHIVKIKPMVFYLAVMSIVCLSLASAVGAARTVGSADIVPSRDWTYDALGYLAARGLIPGFSARVFAGDRLFNRLEMANLVEEIIDSSADKNLGFTEAALLGHLVAELRAELGEDAVRRWEEECRMQMNLPLGDEVTVMGWVKGSTYGNGESGARGMYNVSGFINLSSGMFGMATGTNRRERFFHEPVKETKLDKVSIRGATPGLQWAVGREYLNWGPGYSGSLILSENSPAFWQGRVSGDVNFGKLLGRMKITQFVSPFTDEGKNVYLLGRRYEKPVGDRWRVGISETAKVSSLPNPLILVLPYYLYQHVFDEVDEEFNCLYSADLSYYSKGGVRVYGELLVDDMTAPRIFGSRFKRPRKTGYLAGFYMPVTVGKQPSTLRAEYIFIDRRTYEATRSDHPEMAYSHEGDIIGHPIGPNANAVYARWDQKVSDSMSIIGEYLNQWQTERGVPERGSRRVISLQLSWDIAPDKSVSVRVAPYKECAVGGTVAEGTSYEARVSFAF